MKKILYLLLGIGINEMGLSETSRELAETQAYLDSQKFLSSEEVRRRWGRQKFRTDKFKNGGVGDRSAMAAELIDGKTMVGKTPEEIRALLGDFTGHFWSDGIPAYLINEGWKTGGDTWQLVFLLNPEGKVAELRVHRNCCSP